MCVGFLFFKIRHEVTADASLRVRVWRTFCDLYCSYFSPKVTVKLTRKARGHSVTLTERACIIQSNPGHICVSYTTSQAFSFNVRLRRKRGRLKIKTFLYSILKG